MFKYLYALIILGASVNYVWSDPPKPGGPYKIGVNDVAEIEIEEFKPGTLGFHNPYDVTDLFIREATPRRAGTVSFIVQPRKSAIYRLTVWTQDERAGATLIIDATGKVPPRPDPDPKPDPEPEPQPDPDPPQPEPLPPITSEHWFIVVEETEDRTLEQSAVLDFRKWNTLGVKYRFYDDDSPEVKRLGYDRLLERFGMTVPVLFVFDKNGGLVSVHQLPKTFEEVKKIREGTLQKPRSERPASEIVPVQHPQPIYVQKSVYQPRYQFPASRENCPT